jgi:hypothetical protein
MLALCLAAGCSAGGSGGATPTPTPTPVPGCHATPKAADRTRFAVVAHPYDAGSNPSPAYEVLALSTSGALSHAADFALGRATGGRIAFTPDGEIGVVAEEDGRLGVFRIADDGTPAVVTSSFQGSFYAGSVVIDPSGDRAFVLDPDTVANGGGIYEVDLACDGTPSDGGLLLATGNPGGIGFLDASHAVVATRDIAGAAAGDDAVLLDLSATATLLGGVDAFGDDTAIVPDLALTADGLYALIPDDNAFSGNGGRIAVVEIGESLSARQLVGTVPDPPSIVASPFAGGGALVLSADQGNTAWWLKEDASNATAPFTLDSEVAWSGAGPQLPLVAVTIDRGALEGRVLIAENLGIRQVAFPSDGGKPVDAGLHSFGSGLQHITGALGVQP